MIIYSLYVAIFLVVLMRSFIVTQKQFKLIKKEKFSNFLHLLFLIRWGLIGKFHCETGGGKKLGEALFYITWILFSTSVVYLICSALGYK